jgi:RND family efflux transporter MFP subunit
MILLKHDQIICMKTFKNSLYLIPMAAMMILAGCGTPAEEETTQAEGRQRIVAVETMQIELAQFEDRIRINGNVTAFDDAVISVETAGQVQFVVERGTRVKKGDVILRLDDRLLQANFNATKTGFELAEDAFKRQEALYADSVISTMQYLQSKAQRDQAAAQFTAIQKQLEDAQLKAPFNGRIEERLTSEGQFVGPGTPVLRLINTDQVKISGGIPERYAGRIEQGSEVEISFRSYGFDTRTAKVQFVGNLINPDSRTFPVEVVLNNADGSIKPRMVVEMRVLRDELTESIIVPRTSIIRNDLGLSVFVVTDDNGQKRAVQRPVTIALSSGDFVVIEEGVQPGEEIVTAGFTSLNDGDLLNVTNTRSASDLLN